MKLYDAFALGMLAELDATTTAGGIGTQGSLDFYTLSSVFTSTQTVTGMLNVASRVKISGTKAISVYSTSTNMTRCTAVFNAMTTGVVDTGYTAAAVGFFAILNTNAGTASTANIVLTGTVMTGTTGDINFNVTSWDSGDNISITSLTFVQPQ